MRTPRSIRQTTVMPSQASQLTLIGLQVQVQAVFQVICSSPSALIRIQVSALSSPSSSTHLPGAQRTSTFSAAKAARAQAMSSSHGVWSLSRYRLFHLPTALGSQVTGTLPAWHFQVWPFWTQSLQGPSAAPSQAATAL